MSFAVAKRPDTATPAQAGDSPALELSDVHYGFAGPGGSYTEVLGGVSFAVEKSEFVAVMGPSGCGKSTLVKLAAGFEEPDDGRISCEGTVVSRPDAARGVVFQKPALYPWLTVMGNMLFGPSATGRSAGARERATKLLGEMGLAGYEDYRPYQLSGGMQHRVALGRTLVNEPEVLMMDEPFAALDAQTREDMQELLLEIWQRHRSTVLFITHDIEEGLLLADRVIVLGTRPATVVTTIEVDFPRPRTFETVLQPEFQRLRNQVRQLLHNTARGTAD